MAQSASADDTDDDDDRSEPSTVTEQELFDVLSNSRRLAALRYLANHGGSAELGTLVDAVATEEFDAAPEDLDRREERRVYVALHQNHLPYLEEVGLVEWDRSQGIVSLREAGPVRSYLAGGVRPAHRSYRLPLALAGCAVGLVVADLAFLEPGTLPPVATVALVAALVLAAGGVTELRERRRVQSGR
jgi:hypothetical protein